MRRLVITFRDVPAAHLEAHRRVWSALRAAVLGAGGKAWVFHAERDPTRVVEFLEYRAGLITEVPGVATALGVVDREFPLFERSVWVPGE